MNCDKCTRGVTPISEVCEKCGGTGLFTEVAASKETTVQKVKRVVKKAVSKKK